jgi:hypothetical protein
MKNLKIIVCFLFVFSHPLFAQEVLKSDTEEYYDFLSLEGLTGRPTLNYRTLSDSVWNITEGTAHPLQDQNLGVTRRIIGDLSLRVYGPELFSSFNTTAPYGQNDAALWQGKGFNAALSGGLRLEGYGIAATFKPQLVFSQNAEFGIMAPEFSGPNYDGKAAKYGYFWGNIDAPQRFGDKSIFAFDWGDSEIRYSWKTLTIGFGTQSIWLGPAYLNPILHSNNAPTYPKIDLGIRRQPVTIPWTNWYIGDIEFRIWTGYLSESDFFDNNPANDHTMFHGLSFAYAPSFLPGLTLSANRVCMVPWDWGNLKFMLPLAINNIEDQKASFSASYFLPQAGISVYGELGIDDYVAPAPIAYIRYPFHTMTYLAGLKKTLNFNTTKYRGELIFEWSNMEISQDFQYQWPSSFYFHGLIIHGYTNKGQLLGNGMGVGGNSQYLGIKLYHPKGSALVFIHRFNPDNNFIYKEMIDKTAVEAKYGEKYYYSWKANLIIGLNASYFVTKYMSFSGGAAYNLILNPQYYLDKEIYGSDKVLHNFSLQLGIKISI